MGPKKAKEPAKAPSSNEGQEEVKGSEGGKVKEIKEISRSMNSDQARVMVETIHKEEKCRDKFYDNAMYFRKSRNPCNGELTARDNAEFLIPIERTIKMNFETEKFLDFDQTYNTMKSSINPKMQESLQTLRKIDVHKLETVRDRKAVIAYELEQMKKAAEFKAQLLSTISK
jgi:hypothetical protein